MHIVVQLTLHSSAFLSELWCNRVQFPRLVVLRPAISRAPTLKVVRASPFGLGFANEAYKLLSDKCNTPSLHGVHVSPSYLQQRHLEPFRTLFSLRAMNIPPAVIGVIQLLPSFLLWPAATFASIQLVQQLFDLSVPIWAAILISILSQQVAYSIRTKLRERRHNRAAAVNGVERPPKIEGSELSFILASLKSFRGSVPGDIFLHWSQKYGPTFRFRVFAEDRIVTFEPEHIKAILATQFNSFIKGPILFDQVHDLMGSGVFNSDSEMWKFHRTMTRPFFTRDRISDFDIFDRHAADAIARIKARLAEGFPVEFQDTIARFTLDSATEFLFGSDVCSLSAGLPYPPRSGVPNTPWYSEHPSNKFVRAFVRGQEYAATRGRVGPFWRLTEPWRDELKGSRKVIDGYVEPIVREALMRKEEKREKGLEEAEGETFLDHLVGSTSDIQVMKDSIVNILVAGRDTTAGTLTFALYMLAEHPDVTKKLRDKILAKVGPTARPTYDDVHSMRYLRAFINEVLRMYPSVPYNARIPIEPVIFPRTSTGRGPYYVPARTKCIYSVFFMHRRKDLWGPDALKFDPDRFIDERLHKYLTPNPFIFVPFNAGPRICLGQQFAYNEISFFLVRFLQNFSSFSLDDTGPLPVFKTPDAWRGEVNEKVEFAIGFTMSVKDGLWMRMKEAEPSESQAV